MSGDHAKREIVTGDKPTSSGRTLSRESGHKQNEESSSSNKTHRRSDKKKKMKKVVYYETDSSSPSTSSSDSSSTTSKRHERKKYSKMPLRYPRISRRTPLLSVPLMPGSSVKSISTPRSPRATMTASAADRMLSMLLTPSRFSILAMMRQ